MPLNVTGIVALPSVTTKRIETPSGLRTIEPASTIPPSRTALPSGSRLSATSPGA